MATETSNEAEKDESLDLEIEGNKYTIPKKFAEYIAKKQTEITDDYKKFTNEINRLNGLLKTKDDEGDDEDKDSVDSLLFTDPKQAINKITESVKQSVHDDLSTKSAQETAKQLFWVEFYKTNKDLIKDEDSTLIEYLFARNFNKFSDKTVGDVIKELGEMTRQEILRISRKFNKNVDTDEAHSLEPILTINKKGNNKKVNDADDFDSISDIIKKRKHDILSAKR